MPFAGPNPGAIPCVNPFVLSHDTNPKHQIDAQCTFPLEDIGGEAGGAVPVLPSSDSIRSIKTDETVSSWRSSSTGSTLATSVTSSLGKGASTIWNGLGEIGRLSGSSITSRWRQNRLLSRPSEESHDLEVGVSLPLQALVEPRTYSGCDSVYSSGPKEQIATSIHLTFDFEYKRHTFELEYSVFRQWKYLSLLIIAVQEDGVDCTLIWDELEGLQVMAGDWEARARPGWQVTVFCEDSEFDDDDCSEMDEKEELWENEKGFGEEWWFKRWKTRVEKKKEGLKKKRKPWVIGAVAMAGITVAFCAVTWFSLTEDRAVTIG